MHRITQTTERLCHDVRWTVLGHGMDASHRRHCHRPRPRSAHQICVFPMNGGMQQVWEPARKRDTKQCEISAGLGVLSLCFIRVGRVPSGLTAKIGGFGVNNGRSRRRAVARRCRPLRLPLSWRGALLCGAYAATAQVWSGSIASTTVRWRHGSPSPHQRALGAKKADVDPIHVRRCSIEEANGQRSCRSGSIWCN